MSNLQHRTDVASTLDSKLTSQYIMDAVMVTSMQSWNPYVEFTTSSRRRYYDVAPTLHQFWEEHQMWIIVVVW